jgi:hypothetical protein
VQVLLELGAVFNTQDGDYGNTLVAACSEGHTVADNNGWTPVDVASSNGYLEVAKPIDPRSGGDEFLLSRNDVYVQQERNEKTEDIFHWSVSVSVANSDAGTDTVSSPRPHPQRVSRKRKLRIRARITGGHPLEQEDYFKLKPRTRDASFPGPGVLVHESSDDLSEAEANIDTYSEEPSADVDEPGRYDRSTFEAYSSFSPTTDEQSTLA